MRRQTWTLLTLLAVATSLPLLGLDCGGAPCADGQCLDGGAGSCVYNGKTYKTGDSFPSADGCNTCSCQNGQAACTLRACVSDAGSAGQWYQTCGDPVCHDNGHRVDPNIPNCTTEKAGAACNTLGVKCDPNDPCNTHLVCATMDPTKQPGGCPISRAKYKRDIAYLGDAERAAQLEALRKINLATYRYRATGPDGPQQLGFIIDDLGASPAVNADGETVNLYGYTSMAVAALQTQQKQIEALQKQLETLQQRLDASAPRHVGKSAARR